MEARSVGRSVTDPRWALSKGREGPGLCCPGPREPWQHVRSSAAQREDFHLAFGVPSTASAALTTDGVSCFPVGIRASFPCDRTPCHPRADHSYNTQCFFFFLVCFLVLYPRLVACPKKKKTSVSYQVGFSRGWIPTPSQTECFDPDFWRFPSLGR